MCQIAKEHDVGSNVGIYPVLKQAIKHQSSDSMCWCLFYMGICNQELSEEFATAIVKTRDCMAMGMLIALNQHREKVIEFLNTEIDPDIKYDCDQYWLLIHELASDCPKFDCYREESGVGISAERKCVFYQTDRYGICRSGVSFHDCWQIDRQRCVKITAVFKLRV